MVARTDRRTARPRAVLAGLVTFVVCLLALGWGVRLIVVLSGLEPAGPACSYEVDEGSGPAGYGRERLDWGLWPTRVCATETGDVSGGGAVDPTSPLQPDLFELENALWWIGTAALALVASALAGGLTARAVLRRSPS